MTRNKKGMKQLISWLHTKDSIYCIDDKKQTEIIETHLQEFMNEIEEIEKQADKDQYLYDLVQKIFMISDEFDKAMIYFIRCVTKNFLRKYSERSFNGIPIFVTIIADANDMDDYITSFVMKMDNDA
jgi:hypothetical protein